MTDTSDNGSKIEIINGQLSVPDNPIIPFIEGDGIGPDIWRATVRVLDAAVEKAIPNSIGITMNDVAHVVAGKEQKIEFCNILFNFLDNH